MVGIWNSMKKHTGVRKYTAGAEKMEQLVGTQMETVPRNEALTYLLDSNWVTLISYFLRISRTEEEKNQEEKNQGSDWHDCKS